MKMNPVYRRELTVTSRSFRMAMILTVFNLLLAVVALLNMYSVVAQVKMTAEIQYSSFLEIYIFVATLEFILLMFIMPALTAGSISGERERQTLDLMLTTKMSAADIVLGKLFSCFSIMFLLVVSSFPALALVFVYGGIMLTDLLWLLACYFTVALFSGSLGICFSSVFKKSTMATVISYGILALAAAGSYGINSFALAMSRMNMTGYMNNIGSMADQANSGMFLYFLLLNPAATFYVMINGQAGDLQSARPISQWFGNHPENFVTEHWVAISLALQLLIAVFLILIAIRAINPVKKRR